MIATTSQHSRPHPTTNYHFHQNSDKHTTLSHKTNKRTKVVAAIRLDTDALVEQQKGLHSIHHHPAPVLSDGLVCVAGNQL